MGNSTKLYRKQDLNVFYHVWDFLVFVADWKTKMAVLASDIFSTFFLNRWTDFNDTWQEARSQRLLLRLWFSDRLEIYDGHSGPWLAERFSTFSVKPLRGNQRNLKGSKISTSSTKFRFFQADWKSKMTVLVSDLLRHFRLLLLTRLTEFTETWQEARSQRPLPSLCFLGPIWIPQWPS